MRSFKFRILSANVARYIAIPQADFICTRSLEKTASYILSIVLCECSFRAETTMISMCAVLLGNSSTLQLDGSLCLPVGYLIDVPVQKAPLLSKTFTAKKTSGTVSANSLMNGIAVG